MKFDDTNLKLSLFPMSNKFEYYLKSGLVVERFFNGTIILQ